MDNEMSQPKKYKKCATGCSRGAGGCAYGLALIGSAIYFLQNATSFWQGVLAILKAIIWPALVAFVAFPLLKMLMVELTKWWYHKHGART